MHRIFQIAELTRIVCQHVVRDNDVLHLGSTASLFLEPALDILWWEQKGLRKMLKCFPQAFWDEQSKEWAARKLTLSRPLKLEDWDRFNFYAKRVKKLDMNIHTHADKEVYDIILSSVAKPRYLFPRLLSLKAQIPSYYPSWPFLDALLVPSLTDLTVILTEERSMAALSFFYQIHVRCPHISSISFTLSEYEDVDEMKEALSSSISLWKDLKIVDIPYVSAKAITHLSQTATLTELNFSSVMLTSIPDFGENAFPALEDFEMDNRPSHCAKILRAISSCHLNTIRLCLLGPFSRLLWAEVIGAVTAFKSRYSSLKDLDICEYLDDGDTRTGTVLSIADLKPLLSLRGLTDVSIDAYKRLDLSNKDIKRMARAWPELSDFTLGNRTPKDVDPPCRVTMEALATLVKHCPSLHRLSIPFIAKGAKLPPSKPGDGICNKAITILHVDDSIITADAIPIAASYLSSIFPSLKYIFTSQDDTEEEKHWDEVAKLLPFMSNIRRQEKSHWHREDSSSDESTD